MIILVNNIRVLNALQAAELIDEDAYDYAREEIEELHMKYAGSMDFDEFDSMAHARKQVIIVDEDRVKVVKLK